jgi:hypothetical protein
MCLGHGENGAVRYVREEVVFFEKNRKIKMTPDR